MLSKRVKKSTKRDVITVKTPVIRDEEFSNGWYVKYLEAIKDPNYTGIDYDEPSSTSKYSEYNTLKNIFGEPVPKPDNQNINDYLGMIGYGPNRERRDKVSMGIEGWCDEKTMSHHSDICIENNVKRVMQIGFNSGMSAEAYLLTEGVEEVLSLDIATHSYLSYANLLIQSKYPGKHLLIAGDSRETVPTFHSMFPNKQYDFIFIDGDHTFDGAYNDIKNCAKLARQDTILILDDVCPHKGSGIGVYKAMLKCIAEGIISFVSHHKVSRSYTAYRNGYAVCKYGKDRGVPVPYLQIESMIPVTYYTRKIEEATDIKTINRYINIIKEQEIETDEYLVKLIKTKLTKLSN